MFLSSKKVLSLISSIKTLTMTIDKIDRVISRSEKENERLSMELKSTNKKNEELELILSKTKSNIEKLGISYDFISQASDIEIEVSRMLVDIKINKDGLKNPTFSNDLQRKSAISIVKKLITRQPTP